MKKPVLNPNPERHYIRRKLAEMRRECWKLSFHIKYLKSQSIQIKPEKMTRLRELRRDCKKLSQQLKHAATNVKISNGEEVWIGKSFKRFRHSARGNRWFKVRGGWRAKDE